MNWESIAFIIYIGILASVCLRIIFETNSTNKTLAYLLLCLFVPFFGMLFYLAFGINYWRKRRYDQKILQDITILDRLKKDIVQYNKVNLASGNMAIDQNAELASMLIKDLGSPLTASNSIKLLVNGEQKFPELMNAIREAKHHIHLEYYIYEYDSIGTQLVELLIKKAIEGVKVRFIYDDFGSPSIKKKTEKRMRDAGVEIHPFYKVLFYILANRINYRNHRKIVVIDGHTAFTGGINVSDKYVNGSSSKLFWRDTHIRIDGPAVYYLQYLFIADWNFCCSNKLIPDASYFADTPVGGPNTFVQIAASGPDSFKPSVLYSILQTIYLAQKEILITTPYFIPGDSILDALCIAALSGLVVKLLVPGICDSKLVNAASKSYYRKLLESGVEIYIYQKGFVHAKTMVTDGKLSVVGTANMDYRSFELNFEVNTIIYDATFAEQMRDLFFNDIQQAEKIDKEMWISRSALSQLPEKLARLFSPVL
ncbi:MAG: cls [Chitinophagaceae bacterium]|nr:cls [Chitinophagaceae bacterium]